MAFQLIDSSAVIGVDVTSGTGASLDVVIGCTLQTDDVVLLCHWHERNNNANTIRRVPLDSNGAHPTGFDCVSKVNGTDQNWAWYGTCYNTSGSIGSGSAAEIGVGVYSYKVTSTDAKDSVVVTLTQPVAASATNTSKCVVRVLVLRGVEYTNSANTAVVARSSRYPATNNDNLTSQSHISWDDPTVTSTNYWNSTTYSGEVLGVYLGAMRPSNNIDPSETTPSNVTTTAISSWHTGEADDSTVASTTPAGFSTTTRGHTQVVCIMSYADFSAASFTNRYLSRDGTSSTGDQATIFLPFGITASAGTIDVTGTATAGTLAASATVGTQRGTADLSGTSTVGTFSTTGVVDSQTLTKTLPASSASMLVSTAAPPPSVITTVTVSGSASMLASTSAPPLTATTPIETLPNSSTSVGTLTVSGAVGKETPATGVPASQTSVGTLGATGSVSNETQVQPLPQGTASLALSASATVDKQTPIKPLSGNATLSMSATGVVDKETPVKPVSGAASFGTLGTSASLDSISTVGISGSATLSLSTTGSVAKETTTKTLPASTSSVGTLSVTGSVTIGGQGEVSGSASVGTLQASASVGKETLVKGVSGTVSVGTLSTSGSVQKQTIIETLGAAQVSFSIATQGSVTQATPVKPVAGQAGISISVAGSISVESTGQVDGSISVGTVSATGSIAVLAITSLEVTIDGVGDIVENLLTRSEILAIEEIWNTGLTQLGVGRVDSATDDNSAQAALLRAVWPNFRKQFISDHAWNGCKTTAQLTALPDSDFKDTTRWSNIFSLPSDYIRALTVNGHRNQPDNSESVMWEIEVVANTSGTKSRCLCTNQSTAKLEYVFDVGDSVDLLAPAMKHAMGLAFGAFVAPNFGKTTNEIALLEQKVKENLLKARGIDGQENSARYFSPSELVESRYRSL